MLLRLSPTPPGCLQMKDGWWWYTWGTWALLVLQGGVTAGGVVLFAVPPSIERWTAVGVALTMLAATACVVLPAVSKDNQQRRQDAKNAFKQLEDSTQAALQLAEEVRALRMWRFWKVVFDLFVNMQMTVNKADGMLGA